MNFYIKYTPDLDVDGNLIGVIHNETRKSVKFFYYKPIINSKRVSFSDNASAIDALADPDINIWNSAIHYIKNMNTTIDQNLLETTFKRIEDMYGQEYANSFRKNINDIIISKKQLF